MTYRVDIKPGCVVSAKNEDNGWEDEGMTLVRSYRRHNSEWWVAAKGGVEVARFTVECIYEVDGKIIA